MQEHPSQRTEGHSHLCVHRPARCTEPADLGTLGCWGHAPAALDLTHRDSSHTRESCPSTAPPAHTPAFVLLAGDTEVRRIPGSLCPEQTTSVWMQNSHEIHSHLMSFSKYICLHFALPQGDSWALFSPLPALPTAPGHRNSSSSQLNWGQHTAGHATAPQSTSGTSRAQQQARLPQNPSDGKLKVCSSSPLLTVVIVVSPPSQGDLWGQQEDARTGKPQEVKLPSFLQYLPEELAALSRSIDRCSR